jgi:hypothetical protein
MDSTDSDGDLLQFLVNKVLKLQTAQTALQRHEYLSE